MPLKLGPERPPKLSLTCQSLWYLDLIATKKLRQGHSQPHSPGWARIPLSSDFPQISINFSYFSSNFTYFLPHFGLRVGDSPTRERLGYATAKKHEEQ